MIASHDLDMTDAMEIADDSVAHFEAHPESLAALSDLGAVLARIEATEVIEHAMDSAGVMPQQSPSDESAVAPSATDATDQTVDTLDMDEVAEVLVHIPAPVPTYAVSTPIEIEATSATEGEPPSLADEPNSITADVIVTHAADADITGTKEIIELITSATYVEVATAAPTAVEAKITMECDAPAVTKCGSAASITVTSMAEYAEVPQEQIPAALPDEPNPAPATPGSSEPAVVDTIGMGETVAMTMTVSEPVPACVCPPPPQLGAPASANVPEIAPATFSASESDEVTALATQVANAVNMTSNNSYGAGGAPAGIAVEKLTEPEGEAPVPTYAESAATPVSPAPLQDSAEPAAQVSLPLDPKPVPADTLATVVASSPAANPALAMALKFVERGIPVFPLFGIDGDHCTCGNSIESGKCSAGKHPRHTDSFNGATTKEVAISMWAKYNPKMNYGVSTGRQFGATGKILVVVDIDWYKPQARQTVEDLEQAGYFFPDTAEVLTGGGGRHLYYLAQANTKFAQTAGPGIDIKGVGGYVIGPGSMHKSGLRYDFEASSDLFNGQEIADMPEWMHEKFGRRDVTKSSATLLDAPVASGNDEIPDDEIAAYKTYLEMISPIDRDIWLKVLMALKSRSESDQMFNLADEWSKKAGYEGVEAVRRTWKSIKAEGGITIKSLKRLAAAATPNSDVDISNLMNEPVCKPVVEGGKWPEPQPIASSDPARAYPLDALPMIMQEAVREVHDYSMAPMALVACSALSSLSLAAQGLYDVQRDVGLTGPISLYMLAIAESGERKSTLDTFFIKSAREYEVACAVAAAPELLKFNTDSMAWEAKKKGILDQITKLASNDKDTSVAEKSLASHTAAQPLAPVIPRVIYSDATPEALTRGLASEWPSGGVISSEGGAVFGGHGMNKESQMRNLAVLNELWDGKPIRIDRRTSASYTVNGARLTVAVQVQPATFGAFMEGSGPLARGSGFIARFLTCFPESTQGTRAYKKSPSNWPNLDPFRQRIADLFATTPVIEDGALKPTMLYLGDDAMSVWIDFYNEIEVQLGKGGNLRDVRDVASKTADNAARIAALFHVLAGEAGSINETCMRSGARVAKWHLNESQRVFAGGIASAGKSDAQKLEDWLLAYCQDYGVAEVSGKTISQRGPAALRKKPAHTPVLEELERLGRVKVSGAPARTVYLNPTLLN